MKSIAVLQARTNSSRLPGKVLLPMSGIPLAVLAAKRAANKGRSIIVATSIEESDDALSAMLRQYGLTCFRGSLDNTLNRFVQALSAFDNETIVFRLTADNAFPDGKLLDEVEDDFIQRNLDYLHCNGEPSGLPYGMSVEVTRLGHLREAAENAVSNYDHEHVTPYIIRKFGKHYFEKYAHLKKGHFRCTIDCLDDYLGIQKVFARFGNPIEVDALELVENLAAARYEPSFNRPAYRLILGTTYLGEIKGASNKTRHPPTLKASEIIKTAIANGIIYLDASQAYGDSETVLGQILAEGWAGRAFVISKSPTLSNYPDNMPDYAVEALVESSIYQSCTQLRQTSLDMVMLPRTSHLFEWNGHVWKHLKKLKNDGLIKSLGALVRSTSELRQALNDPTITFIQLPFNILDGRWDLSIDLIRKARQERDLTVHARNPLLNGLLISDDKEDLKNAGLKHPEKILRWIEDQVVLSNRRSRLDLCISYVYSQDWIDGIVIDMETLQQLYAYIDLFGQLPMTPSEIESIANSRPLLTKAISNSDD